MLVPVGVDPDRPDHHHVSGQVEPVHLDRDEIEAGQVRSHPLPEGRLRQRLEAPGNAGLGEARSRILRNAAPREAARSAGVARGDAHEGHVRPAQDVLAIGQPRPGRQRHLLVRPLVANARPPDADPAAVIARGSGRRAPPMAGLVGAASVARVGNGSRVLLEHQRNFLQSAHETELLEAVVHVFQILLRLMPVILRPAQVILRHKAVKWGTSLPGGVPLGAGMCYVMS